MIKLIIQALVEFNKRRKKYPLAHRQVEHLGVWECSNHQEAHMEACNKTRSEIHLVEWDSNLELLNKAHRHKLAQFSEVDN